MLFVVEKNNFNRTLEVIKKIGRTCVFLPRPLGEEKIRKLERFAIKFYMPKSTYERLSKKSKEIIGNRFKIASIRGRFARIKMEKAQKIIALHRAGLSVRKISKETGVPKSTVHYFIKKGLKIRDGKIKVIFV